MKFWKYFSATTLPDRYQSYPLKEYFFLKRYSISLLYCNLQLKNIDYWLKLRRILPPNWWNCYNIINIHSTQTNSFIVRTFFYKFEIKEKKHFFFEIQLNNKKCFFLFFKISKIRIFLKNLTAYICKRFFIFG